MLADRLWEFRQGRSFPVRSFADRVARDPAVLQSLPHAEHISRAAKSCRHFGIGPASFHGLKWGYYHFSSSRNCDCAKMNSEMLGRKVFKNQPVNCTERRIDSCGSMPEGFASRTIGEVS